MSSRSFELRCLVLDEWLLLLPLPSSPPPPLMMMVMIVMQSESDLMVLAHASADVGCVNQLRCVHSKQVDAACAAAAAVALFQLFWGRSKDANARLVGKVYIQESNLIETWRT